MYFTRIAPCRRDLGAQGAMLNPAKYISLEMWEFEPWFEGPLIVSSINNLGL